MEVATSSSLRIGESIWKVDDPSIDNLSTCTTVVMANPGPIPQFTEDNCCRCVLAVYKAIAAGNRANAAEQQIPEDVAGRMVDRIVHNVAPDLSYVEGLSGNGITTAVKHLQDFVSAIGDNPDHQSTLCRTAEEVREKRLPVEPYAEEEYERLFESLYEAAKQAGEQPNPDEIVTHLLIRNEDPPANLHGAYRQASWRLRRFCQAHDAETIASMGAIWHRVSQASRRDREDDTSRVPGVLETNHNEDEDSNVTNPSGLSGNRMEPLSTSGLSSNRMEPLAANPNQAEAATLGKGGNLPLANGDANDLLLVDNMGGISGQILQPALARTGARREQQGIDGAANASDGDMSELTIFDRRHRQVADAQYDSSSFSGLAGVVGGSVVGPDHPEVALPPMDVHAVAGHIVADLSLNSGDGPSETDTHNGKRKRPSWDDVDADSSVGAGTFDGGSNRPSARRFHKT